MEEEWSTGVSIIKCHAKSSLGKKILRLRLFLKKCFLMIHKIHQVCTLQRVWVCLSNTSFLFPKTPGLSPEWDLLSHRLIQTLFISISAFTALPCCFTEESANPNVFVNKVLLNHAHDFVYYLCLTYATKVELSSCNSDYLVSKCRVFTVGLFVGHSCWLCSGSVQLL